MISRTAHRRNHREHLRRKFGARGMHHPRVVARLKSRISYVETVVETTGTFPRDDKGRFVGFRALRAKLTKILGFGNHEFNPATA